MDEVTGCSRILTREAHKKNNQDSSLVDILIKQGVISERAARFVDQINVAQAMHMTLKQVRVMDPFDFELVKAVLVGNSQGDKDANK